MERYVGRGCEDTVIEALHEHGLACILGLPGVGKTTTARYIALKLREKGLIPLILTSGDAEITSKDKVVEFADEAGKTHTILQIPTSAYLTIDTNLAKGLANAIAEVVNTSLKEKTLSQISKAVTKTEWGREVAKAVKSIGDKLDIRVPTETIKNSVEEVSKFVDLREVMEYGAEFCSCFLLGVDVIRLAEKFKGKDKGIKLEKEIVVIIDDVAEFKLSETVALQILIDWLRKNGAGVLLVKRINFEKEFIEISKETSASYVRYANEIFAGSRDASGFFEDKRQAVFLTTPDFDTFKEIIGANVEETLQPKDIVNLFRASGGFPTPAILMHDVGVNYDQETKKDLYYSLEKAKTDVEKARATLDVILSGFRSVYEFAKEKNLALLALFVQPTAHEELEAFCNSSEIERVFGRFNCSQNLDSYKRIVEIREELWVDRMRKFYILNDNWRHMRLFLNVLCDTEEEVKQELKTVRNVLLDIMSDDKEQAGWISGRTLIAALDDINWLKDDADEKLIKQALFWGRTALEYIPEIGFEFLPIILELTRDQEYDELFASAYADQLLERSSFMNLPLNVVKKVILDAECLLRNPSEDPAVQAHRAEAYSAIAKSMMRYGIERESFLYIEKAEKLVRSVKDKETRRLAKISVWLDIADFYTHSNSNEAWHWTEVVSLLMDEVKKNLPDYLSNKYVIDFFKPYGGNVEKQLKNNLDRWFQYAKYLIGQIYMSFDWLDEAEKAFIESLEYAERKDAIHASKVNIAKIRVIRDLNLESFDDLYNDAKYYGPLLYPENRSIACAEYWLACMFLEKEIEEKERKEIEECTKKSLAIYTPLLGVGYMLNKKFSKELVLKALAREKKGGNHAITSGALFTDILNLLIEDERETAFQFALDISQQSYFPLFSRLFAELADAIQREDEDEMKKALVKLFYYLI